MSPTFRNPPLYHNDVEILDVSLRRGNKHLSHAIALPMQPYLRGMDAPPPLPPVPDDVFHALVKETAMNVERVYSAMISPSRYRWSTNDDAYYYYDDVTYGTASNNTITMSNFDNSISTAATTYNDRTAYIKKMKYYDDKQRYYDQRYYDSEPPRRAAPKEFNKYINGSDLLEEFIKYVGEAGARQHEVMSLPVELFVKWLVVRACEEDKVEPNVTLELPAPEQQPRCLGCQRFMKSGGDVPFHDQHCAGFYFDRQKQVAAA